MDAQGGNLIAENLCAAGPALDEPAMHCTAAGPLGAGVCSGACQRFPAYKAGVPNADPLACRTTHLTFAALDADTHGPHVAEPSSVRNDDE